jgi:hypothetical protein
LRGIGGDRTFLVMGTPEPPPVVIIMPPPPERAPDAPAQERPSRFATLDNGGMEISLGTLFFQPGLGHASFEGGGTAPNTQQRQSFHHLGRELGLDAPLMWGGEVSIHYMRRYFAVGLLGFVAGHPGAADSGAIPSSGAPVPDVNQGALTGWGGGVDLAGAVPFGIVALRPGVVLGLRTFSMPITGFDKTTCHGKHGDYPCYETADTAALGFVEPRMRMIITPERSGVSFGAYVGMEIVGGVGPTAGLFFGFGTAPHEGMRP